MGPGHLTAEVRAALDDVDYIVAARKSADDELLGARQQLADTFGIELIAVPDPDRDRDDPADYHAAVAAWHAERTRRYVDILTSRRGTAAFLVWGDPAWYDSTIRIVQRIAEQIVLDYEVLPGIGAPQLLAARHRIVLHEVGMPVHVTTARRLNDAVAAGQRNIVVMLSAEPNFDSLDEWQIWWGANLGTPTEELVHGLVGEVGQQVLDARARAKKAAGWVMDCYLLRLNDEQLAAEQRKQLT